MRELVIMLAKFGFCQNTNKNFKNSMRQYKDGTVRYLIVNMFQCKIASGESLLWNWLVFSVESAFRQKL